MKYYNTNQSIDWPLILVIVVFALYAAITVTVTLPYRQQVKDFKELRRSICTREAFSLINNWTWLDNNTSIFINGNEYPCEE